MEKEITVFICEDDALRKHITSEYFGKGITFAQLFKEENRDKVVESISEFE